MTGNKKTECRRFFQNRVQLSKDFWNELGIIHPCCECERISVSKYSPGPVNDDETLLSVVTSKHYVSIDGYIEPTYFDKRMSNGMSTDRKQYTSLKSHNLRASELVEGDEKKENCGSIEISVELIRKINYRGMRAIAVYDTALLENKSHAEIACTEVPPDRKLHRANLRKSVLDATLHNGQVLESSELWPNPT